MKGEPLGDVARGNDPVNHREPLGVCAGITPFNFPAMVPMWVRPLAIACGNTIVFKPSEKVPRTGMCGINVGVPAPMAFFPFAGWKGSFYGDLHGHGRDGVAFYTEQKVEISRCDREALDRF